MYCTGTPYIPNHMPACYVKTLNVAVATMPVGYSVDLRWRAVWIHLICGKSRYEIAELLFMSKGSVDRYISLYQSTGTVEPRKRVMGFLVY